MPHKTAPEVLSPRTPFCRNYTDAIQVDYCFFSPPPDFCIFSDGCKIFNKQQESLQNRTVTLESIRSDCFFFLKERRSGFRVSLQTPRFLSMSLKNYKHTRFWLQQCQGETAAINAINRNPVAHRFQAGLDGNPSFQGRSPQLQMQQSTPRAPVVCPATSSTAHIP